MKKLRLNRETIAQLGNPEMLQAQGGKEKLTEHCVSMEWWCATEFCQTIGDFSPCQTREDVASCLQDCDYTGGFDTSCLAC